MNLSSRFLTGVFLAVGAVPLANASVIDFEEFSTGNLSNTEVIGGVTFSLSNPTADTFLRIFNGNDSRTAFLLACAPAGIAFECSQSLTVDFGQAVSNVSFDFLSDEEDPGNPSGTVEAYLGGSLVGNLMLFGDGNSLTSEFVDLASFGLFDTLILTSDLDAAGLGYDNFSFEAAVPLPAALWLFGSGLLALFGFRAKTS